MKKIILVTTVMILTCGCRLEKLHDMINERDLCESFEVNDMTGYSDGDKASDIIRTGETYMVCGNISDGNTFLMEIDAEGNEISFQSHFNQYFVGSGTYSANSLVELQGDTGYLICGNVKDAAGIQRAFFAKCDNQGAIIDHAIGASRTYCEYITEINGNYVFAGYSYKGNGPTYNENIYIGKINTDDMELTPYSGNTSGNQRAYAVQAYGNDYLFAGQDLDNDNISVPYIFHTDDNFSTVTLCPMYTGSPGIDEIYIRDMLATPSGYILAGYFRKSQGSQINAFTLLMNNNCTYDGNLREITSNDGKNVQIYGIAEVVADEIYMICGDKKIGEGEGESRHAYALKIGKTTGSVLTTYTYGKNTTMLNERISAVAVAGECNYMMAGYTENQSGNREILMVQIEL